MLSSFIDESILNLTDESTLMSVVAAASLPGVVESILTDESKEWVLIRALDVFGLMSRVLEAVFGDSRDLGIERDFDLGEVGVTKDEGTT